MTMTFGLGASAARAEAVVSTRSDKATSRWRVISSLPNEVTPRLYPLGRRQSSRGDQRLSRTLPKYRPTAKRAIMPAHGGFHTERRTRRSTVRRRRRLRPALRPSDARDAGDRLHRAGRVRPPPRLG